MTKPNSQQLPLRGVAMILIAVALLLVGWGLYSATQKDNSTDVVVTQETTNNQQATPPATTPATQHQAPAATEAKQPAQPPAAPNQGQTQPDNAQVTVHVLNNSTIQGLAAKAKDSLAAKGYKVGHVGNYASSIVPENTVYYTDNEDQARELAATIGGVAEKRPDNLPEETAGSGSLVVVLAGDF